MATPQQAPDEPNRPDPVYLHARREVLEILAALAVAMCWTIGYCAAYGYRLDAVEIKLILGIPSWVFWGVVVPWLAASAFTLYFSLFRMKRDPLGEDDGQQGRSGKVGEGEKGN